MGLMLLAQTASHKMKFTKVSGHHGVTEILQGRNKLSFGVGKSHTTEKYRPLILYHSYTSVIPFELSSYPFPQEQHNMMYCPTKTNFMQSCTTI